MTNTPRYTERSEYGGGDGGNYLTPAETPRPLSPGERARLLRSQMAGSAPSAYDPATNPDPRSEQVVPGFRP